MSQITIVGCDLHDRSMLLKYAVGQASSAEKSFCNDTEGRLAMIEFLLDFSQKQRSRRIVFVYEASGQGYGLYDQLTDQGIECHVLSPAHLPRTPKRKRNKTDAKDAQMLFEQARAFVLAGNELPVVWTPPQALRDDRELVRCRLETAEALTRVKLQVLSLLKRYGVSLPDWYRRHRNWTRRFVTWLRQGAEKLSPVVAPVLSALLDRCDCLKNQVSDLDGHLRDLAKTERYRLACRQLCQQIGVGHLTALTFLTEMGDLSRFSNRRQVAAYLGLCPSSFESGEADDRKGHITRQGPARVRKVLCQAAWTAVRLDQSVRETWTRIRGSKAARGKKAIVAIMRHLAIRMWHIGLEAGVSSELCQSEIPRRHWTSARAQQKGSPPFASRVPRPLANTG